MQKPTETLCCFSLKFIDILVDEDESRAQKESAELLVNVLNNIMTSIIETIDRLEREATDSTKVLGSALLNTRASLNAHLINHTTADVSNIQDKYNKAMIEVAKAMKLFNFCGLSEDIMVNDINGNKIC